MDFTAEEIDEMTREACAVSLDPETFVLACSTLIHVLDAGKFNTERDEDLIDQIIASLSNREFGSSGPMHFVAGCMRLRSLLGVLEDHLDALKGMVDEQFILVTASDAIRTCRFILPDGDLDEEDFMQGFADRAKDINKLLGSKPEGVQAH